jgi:hypothetical protein
MQRADRHVGKHARRRHDPFLADVTRDLAFEDVEPFFFAAVDVWRWSAARRNDGFPNCVLAVRVLAGRQEAVHVADDGDGATFGGFSKNRLARHAHKVSSRR